MLRKLKAAAVAGIVVLGIGCSDFLVGGELDTDPNRPTVATNRQLFVGVQTAIWQYHASELTRLAVEACKPYQLLDRWAVVLVAQLMFLLGAGFLGDPLHAWASEALNASAGESVDRRLALLFAAAVDGMKGSEAGVEPSAKTR